MQSASKERSLQHRTVFISNTEINFTNGAAKESTQVHHKQSPTLIALEVQWPPPPRRRSRSVAHKFYLLLRHFEQLVDLRLCEHLPLDFSLLVLRESGKLHYKPETYQRKKINDTPRPL